MCTAVNVAGYFGRNLDLEYGYNECVIVTPRHYPFRFADGAESDRHTAIIGMAAIKDQYPLYFDAMNEQGLCMAGLNFPGYAHFPPPEGRAWEIAPYELIPRVLCACRSVDEARQLLSRCRVVDLPFSQELPVSPLHWLIADSERALAVEPVAEGLQLHDVPLGVLTNSPPLPMQMVHLCGYRGLSNGDGEERLRGAPPPYSKGMGAMGLPGDLSSSSRFVRAVFTRQHAIFTGRSIENVGQLFHVLDAVAQVRGCNRTADGWELTRYSCCIDRAAGAYFYTTYGNRQITGVRLSRTPLERAELTLYPLMAEQRICWQN